jgi:hypothetical protein
MQSDHTITKPGKTFTVLATVIKYLLDKVCNSLFLILGQVGMGFPPSQAEGYPR